MLMQTLLLQIGFPQESHNIILTDNIKTNLMICNSIHHQFRKHIKIHMHYFKQLFQEGKVDFLHVSLQSQLADIVTKALHKYMFLNLQDPIEIQELHSMEDEQQNSA